MKAMNVSKELIKWRDKHDLTQRDLAKMLGVKLRTIRAWEQDTRKPSGPAQVLLRHLVADKI